MPTWKKIQYEDDNVPASQVTAGQFASGNFTFQGSVGVDTINEKTSATGVTVDSVLLKDGEANLASGKAASISRAWLGV